MILALCAVALAAIAGIAVWHASARWWHALIIAVLCVPFFPPVARRLTGDISAYLPENAFSEGARGVDEFIWAGIYATVMIAVICRGGAMADHHAGLATDDTAKEPAEPGRSW
jgi:hypothetical protein